MYNEVVSRHVGSAGEILLLIPIKPGFAQIPELVLSYSTRLKSLLETLYELRARKHQRGFGEPNGPVEALETLFRVQWTVLETQQKLEDERQLDRPQLLIAAHYDRSWEDYFRRLRSETGHLLDLIFSHCVSFDTHTCGDAYERFIGWIRDHQRPCNFMYAGSPDVTADDTLYLRELARVTRAYAEQPCAVASEQLATLQRPQRSPLYRGDPERSNSAYRTLFALSELRDRMFSGGSELERADKTVRSGFQLFDSALGTVLAKEPEATRLIAKLKSARPLGEQAAFMDGAGRILDPVAWAAEIVKPYADASARDGLPLATVDAGFAEQVQVNILTGGLIKVGQERPKPPEFGCALLVSCRDRGAWQHLLAEMAQRVTSAVLSSPTRQRDDDPLVNFAISYAGFARMGLDEHALAQFPAEFRQGMEARSALLGDSGPNDPAHWELPESNGPKAGSSGRVHLSTVDAMIVLQTASDLCSDGASPLWAALREWRLSEFNVDVVHVQRLDRGPRKNANGLWEDHFGFADGISQPIPNLDPELRLPGLESKLKRAGSWRDVVPLGELLLGYGTRHGELATCASAETNPDCHPLFFNGSFLVVRKLEQDVAAFKAWAEPAAKQLRTPTSALYAAVLGREASGEALAGLRATKPQPTPRGVQSNGADPPLLKATTTAVGRAKIDNDFDYANDSYGEACPFHAHIRRVNPRTRALQGTEADTQRDITDSKDAPRIMRRGMSYGSAHGADRDGERGLFFMAYNASIADQYEILQRWLNGGNSTNILSAQNDILTAPNVEDAAPHWAFLPGSPAPRALPARTVPFVQLRWGMYLFAPSRRGVEWLREQLRAPDTTTREARSEHAAALRKATEDAWQQAVQHLPPRPGPAARLEGGLAQPAAYVPSIARGRARLRELDALPDEANRQAWKKILEEAASTESKAWRETEDVWSAVRAEPNGIKLTKAGLMVGSELGARCVLGDDGAIFSVKEYGRRLRETSGDHYLGHDVVPRDGTGDGGGHHKLAGIPNAYLSSLQAGAYALTLGYARELLEKPPQSMQQDLPSSGRHALSIRDLARVTIARLCETWFAMPLLPEPADDDALRRALTLDLFLVCSRNAFQHAPEEAVIAAAKSTRAVLEQLYASPQQPRDMADQLEEEGYFKGDPQAERRILEAEIGAVVGFAPPTYGSLLRTLDQWIENDQLWVVQRLLASTPQPDRSPVLRELLSEAVRRTPAAPILYRMTKREVRIGDVIIPRETQVLVGLASASVDARELGYSEPEVWMFGGKNREVDREPLAPPHGCPARDAGMLVMLGVLAALCERKEIRRERRGVVSYRR